MLQVEGCLWTWGRGLLAPTGQRGFSCHHLDQILASSISKTHQPSVGKLFPFRRLKSKEGLQHYHCEQNKVN